MSYTKQGINYGVGALPVATIESDLNFLRYHYNFIRVTYPTFNSTQATIDYWKDVCVRAKAKGFFVMWGIYCPTTAMNDWYKFIQKFIDLSSWAATNGVVFGVNESLHGDTTNIPRATQILDLHAAAKLAKAISPTVKLHISLADSEIDDFIATSGTGGTGRGAFDFICLNQYDSLTNFKANVDKLTNAYGNSTRITEYSTARGFELGTEASWKADAKDRADYIEASPVQAGFFYTETYNPESSGKWNLRISNSPLTHHDAFDLYKKP